MEISLNHISVKYNENIVLDDVNLLLNPGCLYLLTGESGSGKSTLLKLLAKKNIPYDGQYLIDESLDIAYVDQHSNLIQSFTLIELLEIANTNKNTINEIITQLDLCHLKDVKIAKMSGGERQRATIAFALLKDADIYLLDEPTAMLDSSHKQIVSSLLSNLVKKGKIVLVCTHEDIELFKDCSIYTIQDKKIVQKNNFCLESTQPILKETSNFQGASVLKTGFRLTFSKPILYALIILGLSIAYCLFGQYLLLSTNVKKETESNLNSYYNNELFVSYYVEGASRYQERFGYQKSMPENQIESIKQIDNVEAVYPYCSLTLEPNYYESDGLFVDALSVFQKQQNDSHTENPDIENMAYLISLYNNDQCVKKINQYTTKQGRYYGISPYYPHQQLTQRCDITSSIDEDKMSVYISKDLATQLELETLNGTESIELNVMVPIASTQGQFGTGLNPDALYDSLGPVYVPKVLRLAIKGILSDEFYAYYSDSLAYGIFMDIDSMMTYISEVHEEYKELVDIVMKSVNGPSEWNQDTYEIRSLVVVTKDESKNGKVTLQIENLDSGLIATEANLYNGLFTQPISGLEDSSSQYKTVTMVIIIVVLFCLNLIIKYYYWRSRQSELNFLIDNEYSKKDIIKIKWLSTLIEIIVIALIGMLYSYYYANYKLRLPGFDSPFTIRFVISLLGILLFEEISTTFINTKLK